MTHFVVLFNFHSHVTVPQCCGLIRDFLNFIRLNDCNHLVKIIICLLWQGLELERFNKFLILFICFFDIISILLQQMFLMILLFSDKTLSIEEKVLLAQSAKERADIVDKYDRVSR